MCALVSVNIPVQLSDMVKIRVQALSLATPECDELDMYERSRVTRRLSVVEGELNIATSRLHDLQRSLEVGQGEDRSTNSRQIYILTYIYIHI